MGGSFANINGAFRRNWPGECGWKPGFRVRSCRFRDGVRGRASIRWQSSDRRPARHVNRELNASSGFTLMELWMRISILAFLDGVRHFSRHSKRWQVGWLEVSSPSKTGNHHIVPPERKRRCRSDFQKPMQQQATLCFRFNFNITERCWLREDFTAVNRRVPEWIGQTQYRWLVGRHFQSGHKLPRWSHGRIIGGATKWKAADGGLLHRDWRSHFGGFARLESDGTLDGNFNPAGGVNGTVDSLLVQPNGKVLINGDFTSVNGASRNGIARLNHDGGLDATVSSGKRGVLPERVTAAALQADGKVLIGTEYGLARAHADGSLDGSFVASIRTGDDRWAVTALG